MTTNFKPTTLSILKNINIKKINFNNQIYCKNFFIYILLLKNKINFISKSNIHIKKFKNKIYTTLKAPYRYKIARHQISVNRYNINFSIRLNISKNIMIGKWSKILKIFNFLKSFDLAFESNLIFTNSLKINFPITFEKNFSIKNYLNENKNK